MKINYVDDDEIDYRPVKIKKQRTDDRAPKFEKKKKWTREIIEPDKKESSWK